MVDQLVDLVPDVPIGAAAGDTTQEAYGATDDDISGELAEEPEAEPELEPESAPEPEP